MRSETPVCTARYRSPLVASHTTIYPASSAARHLLISVPPGAVRAFFRSGRSPNDYH